MRNLLIFFFLVFMFCVGSSWGISERVRNSLSQLMTFQGPTLQKTCEMLNSDINQHSLNFCQNRVNYLTTIPEWNKTTETEAVAARNADKVAALYFNLMNWDNGRGQTPSKECQELVQSLVCHAVFPLCVQKTDYIRNLYPCEDKCQVAMKTCNTTSNEPLGKDIEMFCIDSKTCNDYRK